MMPRAYASTVSMQPLPQPRHVPEQAVVGRLAQGEVEPDLVLTGRPRPWAKAATLAGNSAAVPAGPSGRPMSVADRTSLASPPSAWPT